MARTKNSENGKSNSSSASASSSNSSNKRGSDGKVSKKPAIPLSSKAKTAVNPQKPTKSGGSTSSTSTSAAAAGKKKRNAAETNRRFPLSQIKNLFSAPRKSADVVKYADKLLFKLLVGIVRRAVDYTKNGDRRTVSTEDIERAANHFMRGHHKSDEQRQRQDQDSDE